MNRFVCRGLGLVALVASALPAQNPTVRWNSSDPAFADEQDAAPAVRVWLDQRVYHAGEPVRVGFRTDEDAYVIVARVDWNGNLTVLYPSSRTRVSAAFGGRDTFVRSARLGARGTFVATERPGSTGYVFALASRYPLDLSRLTMRDFSSWVTGVSLGQPSTRYIGDPYRVIQRFARVVLFNENADWDYDVEFYSVDEPYFRSAGNLYSGYCNSASSRSGYGSYYGYSNGFDDDDFGGFGCGSRSYYSCFTPYYGYGYALPLFCGQLGRGYGRVATGPARPVRPPRGIDSSKVNPWAPDSVGRPNVDKGPRHANGPDVMAVDPSRPNPVSTGWRGEDDLSFSIPSRALRGLRERRSETGRPTEGTNAGSGPIPMPSRPTPEMGPQPIEWVRPPRAVESPAGGDVDRMPTRGAIRREPRQEPDRGGVRDHNPPSRSPENPDREPRRAPDSPPREIGGGRDYNPPPRMDQRPPRESPPPSRPVDRPSHERASQPPPPPPPPPKRVEQPPPDKKP